jgi:AraC-like DNA-binding protein
VFNFHRSGLRFMHSNTDALSVWREQVGRQILKLDFKPLSDVPFQAKIKPIIENGGIRIVRWAHTPGLTFRDDELVKDGVDSFALMYSDRSPIHFSHRGRDDLLAKGEATLLHNSEPGSMGSPRMNDFIAIIVPGCPQLENADAAIAERWPNSTPALRLLQSYVSALESVGIARDAETGAVAAGHVVDLLLLATRQRLGLDTREWCARIEDVRVRIALDYIARNFRDLGLAETEVAMSQGISTRLLQRLFEQAGIRFCEHVRELRLQAAHRALTDGRQNSRRILDIALICGFSDVSHFNRVFRKRFGVSPTAVRESGR